MNKNMAVEKKHIFKDLESWYVHEKTYEVGSKKNKIKSYEIFNSKNINVGLLQSDGAVWSHSTLIARNDVFIDNPKMAVKCLLIATSGGGVRFDLCKFIEDNTLTPANNTDDAKIIINNHNNGINVNIHCRNDFGRFFDITGVLKYESKHHPYIIFDTSGDGVSTVFLGTAKELLSEFKSKPWTKVMKQWPGQWSSDFIQFTVQDIIDYATKHKLEIG